MLNLKYNEFKQKHNILEEMNIFLKFLKLTPCGQYAEIEKSSIQFARIQLIHNLVEEEYYYSFR